MWSPPSLLVTETSSRVETEGGRSANQGLKKGGRTLYAPAEALALQVPACPNPDRTSQK